MKKHNSDINPKNYYGLAFDVHDEERLKKFQSQRIEKGFDETEWYGLNSTILRFALPRLKEFRIYSKSYPYKMTPEEWNAILDKMILEIEDYLSGVDDVEPTLFFKYFSQLWS
jgi:hypothetical protein